MSTNEENDGVPEKDFCVEIAKQGRANCKKCKEKCAKDEVRLAKLVHNPFADGKMKSWHHVKCLFELFLKQRPTTKRIKTSEDIDGFDSLPSENQDELIQIINQSNKEIAEKYGTKAESPIKKVEKKEVPKKVHTSVNKDKSPEDLNLNTTKPYPFKEFRRLIANISNVNAYTEKTQIVSDIFKNGVNGNKFEGDILLWCRLLLPGVIKRIYNLQSKQLVKIFSRIFETDQKKMLKHLQQGDVGETIQHFYEINHAVKPVKKSKLTVEDVDNFLEELSKLTKEEDQTAHFQSILKDCTSNDLKIIIRLIKHDLRMNAGAKHILDGVHPDAYEAYQSSRDLGAILRQCLNEGKPVNSKKEISAKISVMTPVLPMLAEACKSVEMAMKKCPNGMYSEIKYDGERVQVHKKGSEFKYFSRSLKPVLQHKIAHFKDYIPQAFPSGNDLILDSEILMIDIETQTPLPFGSLGKHKRDEYENACVCLFVFDCIYYNGEDLTKQPIKYRKQILSENMTEVKNHIVFSESQIIHKPADLKQMMIKVFKEGLEGLVLKDLHSIYEPGKRHWLKVKKDYLFDGAMADSADLIVLGAWYGTGKKGGKMSVFLMGCYDKKRDKFCTVTKVHTGIDDKTLDQLQEQLQMIKINSAPNKIPDWLLCNRPMVPDFIAKDPKNQPVWEITGAEFTQHDVHTADGISIRFPRVTKMRHDKDWQTATNLKELKKLFEKSKTTNVTEFLKDENEEVEENVPSTSMETVNCTNSPKKRVNENDYSSPNRSEGKLKRKGKKIASPGSSEKKRKKDDNVELEERNFSYLKDVRLCLEDDVKVVFSNWSKDLSSFNNILLKENEKNKATHVLHMNRFVKTIDRTYPNSARHVIFEWIKDSVDNEYLQDFRYYSVKWRPDL